MKIANLKMRKPSTPKMPSSNPIAPRNSKRGGFRLRRPGVGSFGPKGLKSPCLNLSKFCGRFNWMSKSRYMNRNSEIALRKDFAKSEVSSWNDSTKASIQNSFKKNGHKKLRNADTSTITSTNRSDHLPCVAGSDHFWGDQEGDGPFRVWGHQGDAEIP